MNINLQNGRFEHGKRYGTGKRMAVVDAILELRSELGDPRKVTYKLIAERAEVSVGFANKIGRQYLLTGTISTAEEDRASELASRTPRKITPYVALVLLSLRVERDTQTLSDYCRSLYEITGVSLSHTAIDKFFKTQFEFRGSLRKPNMVPLDKWKPRNIEAYHEFMRTIANYPDHTKFHWLDEKHLANKDCTPGKVRVDPLTGRIRAILVTGSFRMSYSMIAIMSASLTKPCPVNYVLGQDTNNAVSFQAFIEHLVVTDWFSHDEVLILDNAPIHTGAMIVVREILWSTVRNGRPLNVVVVPLPTRSPELNPIELVFHILARRLRADKYRPALATEETVPRQVRRIFDDLSTETVLRCCGHCGY